MMKPEGRKKGGRQGDREGKQEGEREIVCQNVDVWRLGFHPAK